MTFFVWDDRDIRERQKNACWMLKDTDNLVRNQGGVVNGEPACGKQGDNLRLDMGLDLGEFDPTNPESKKEREKKNTCYEKEKFGPQDTENETTDIVWIPACAFHGFPFVLMSPPLPRPPPATLCLSAFFISLVIWTCNNERIRHSLQQKTFFLHGITPADEEEWERTADVPVRWVIGRRCMGFGKGLGWARYWGGIRRRRCQVLGVFCFYFGNRSIYLLRIVPFFEYQSFGKKTKKEEETKVRQSDFPTSALNQRLIRALLFSRACLLFMLRYLRAHRECKQGALGEDLKANFASCRGSLFFFSFSCSCNVLTSTRRRRLGPEIPASSVG